MSARADTVDGMEADTVRFSFEAIFRAQFGNMARVIARVIRDPARAEELAVEVFLKLWRNPQVEGEKTNAWLYRTAVRRSLDELRQRTRKERYERLVGIGKSNHTPEEIRISDQERERVRLALATIPRRQAEMLILRSHDLSYDEIAAALDLNPVSVGTLLSRAQHAFRKEYTKRYGER